MNLVDGYDSIWASCFDELGDQVMGVTGDDFARMSKDEVTEYVKKIRYRQVKVKLVSKNDEYKGEIRRKISVVKVMELNYPQETMKLLERVQKRLSEQ